MFYKYKKTGKKTSQLLMSGLLCGLLMSSALNAMEEKEGNNENHSGVISVRHNEPTDLQAILTRLNLMSSTISTLTQQVEELSNRLKAPVSPLSATLGNDNSCQWGSSSSQWTVVPFNDFFGDLRLKDVNNSSSLQIPEDGTYKVVAKYHWVANENQKLCPWVSIAVDSVNNRREEVGFVLMPITHHVSSLSTTLKLAKGQKIMMAYMNHEGGNLSGFSLAVEKFY